MNLVLEFFCNLLLSFCEVVAWKNIAGIQLNKKDIKLYIQILLLAIITFVISNLLNDFMNAIGIVIFSIVFCKLILRVSLREAIILSFIGELLVILSESVFAIIVLTILNIDINVIAKNIYITNLAVSLLIVLFSKIKYLSKIYRYLYKITKNIKLYQLIVFLLFTIFSIAFCYAATYFKNNIQILIIVNIIIAFFYSLIVMFVFKYQSKYYEINSKYNLRLDDLYTQEELINDYRIMNHENKNNLKTIYSMTTDKDVKKYINSLLEYNNTKHMNIIDDTLKLPSKGIRALLYNKIIVMNDKEIGYVLTVDKKIKMNTLKNISDNDIVDLCQLLGVFVDNAIESVLQADKKEINISFYLEHKNLIITIENCHNNNFVINSDNSFATTKGKRRGYGLKLVKRIIDENDKLSNETLISKNTFTQTIKYNLK